MKNIIKTLKIMAVAIGILVLGIMLYLGFLTATDYKPDEVIALVVEDNQDEILQLNEEITAVSFNIGYGGLDKERDFFLDGGTESRSYSKEQTLKNLEGVVTIVKAIDPELILFQEIDIDSTRSYKIDQYEYLKDAFSGYSMSFAYNYKVPWVALPVTKPTGTVEAGLMSLSKFKVEEVTRYQYPGFYSWPKQLAMLDRCFMETRMTIENGKELIFVNSHLSAYDKGGTIRKQQLTYLKDYLKRENDKGNYIIIGGDWNHLIPGTDPKLFETQQEWPEWLVTIPDDFLIDGFKWVADATIPSNRSVDMPYIEGVNFLSVIDGFLVSANVEVEEVMGMDTSFEFSDHNPVYLKFKLKD